MSLTLIHIRAVAPEKLDLIAGLGELSMAPAFTLVRRAAPAEPDTASSPTLAPRAPRDERIDRARAMLALGRDDGAVLEACGLSLCELVRLKRLVRRT